MSEFVALNIINNTVSIDAEHKAAYAYWQDYKNIIDNMSLTEMCALRLATDRQDKNAIYNLMVGKFIHNRAKRG